MSLDTVAVAQSTPDNPQPWKELGLKQDEYENIRQILCLLYTSDAADE